MADTYERNIFQIGINTGEVRAVFSQAPTKIIANYTAVALHNQTLYWTDMNQGIIGKTDLGGADTILYTDAIGRLY